MNSAASAPSLLYNQISGGEQPGEVTYAEAFAVQPFGNTLVVKTCTGQQMYDVLEQQFETRLPDQPGDGGLAGDVRLHAGRARRVEARHGRVARDRRGDVVDKAASTASC